MITRRYNVRLFEPGFYEITSAEKDARVTLVLTEAEDLSLGTHRISINDGGPIHIGYWIFYPKSLFCDNKEENGLRLELSATNQNDGNRYDFYLSENYIQKDDEILDRIMTLIVEIAHKDSIEHFDRTTNSTYIGRIRSFKTT